MRDQRPLSQVSTPVLALLAAGLALQIGLHAALPEPQAKAPDLLPPPSIKVLRLASLGEPIALAKMLTLQLQAFDYQSGSKVAYKDLDYGRVEDWLARILELDPAGNTRCLRPAVCTPRSRTKRASAACWISSSANTYWTPTGAGPGSRMPPFSPSTA